MSIEPIGAVLASVLASALSKYIEALNQLAGRVFGDPIGVSVGVEPRTIDQRLIRLDEAKAALSESLTAIEQLQAEAEQAKARHVTVRAELAATMANKDDAERKLESIKRLMAQDIEAFQAVAGIPNVRRERFIGFGTGIVTSILASILWLGGGVLLRHFHIIE